MKLYICHWNVDVWAKVSISRLIWAFMKARIITEQLSNNKETDSDNDESNRSMLGVEIVQLLNSETEDEKLNGFVED